MIMHTRKGSIILSLLLILIVVIAFLVAYGKVRAFFGYKSIRIAGETYKYTELVRGVSEDEEPPDDLPLLLALHGYGDHAINFGTLFNDVDFPVRIIVPRAFERAHTSWYDWEHRTTELPRRAKQLIAFTDAITKKYAEGGRPILFGFSQGGVMSTYLVTWYPEYFSSGVIAGAALADNLFPHKGEVSGPYPRILQYHGVKDSVVMFDQAQRSVGFLKKLGFDVEFMAYDASHQCFYPDKWDELFTALEVLTWEVQGE